MISTDEATFKIQRLAKGIHRQRGGEAYMLRLRIPGGRLSVQQWRAAAELATRHLVDHLHLTLRQDIQLYGLPLEDASSLAEALQARNLSSLASGGSSVRNITCSALGTLEQGLPFDPYPYARALSQRLSRTPWFANLPRKFKIGFAGPGQEQAQAWLNDLGFIPKIQDSWLGFRVVCGGGLGASPQNALEIAPFIPAAQVGPVSEAVLDYFAEHAPQGKPAINRFKHVVRSRGLEDLRSQIRQRMQGRAMDHIPLAASQRPGAGERVWISPLQGDLNPAQALALGECLAGHGIDEIRLSFDQRLLIPYVEAGRMPELLDALRGLGLQASQQRAENRLVVCTGPQTCNRGLVNSKALARELEGAAVLPCELHVSGCQNGCSQHLISPLSLQGTVVASPLGRIPSYVLRAGSSCGDGGISFGVPLATLPARRVKFALVQLISTWNDGGPGRPPFDAWLAHLGKAGVAEALGGLAGPAEADETRDCGSLQPFEVALGSSECH